MQQWYQCPNCGAPVAFGVRFCGNCRTQLNWPAQQQPQHPPVYQQPQQQRGYGHGQVKAEQQKTSSWLVISIALIVVVLLVGGGVFAFNAISGKTPPPSSPPITPPSSAPPTDSPPASDVTAPTSAPPTDSPPVSDVTAPTIAPPTDSPPASDVTAPTITSVSVSSITEGSAVITWITDEPASSQVEYGKTADYGLASTLKQGLVVSHSITLSSLEPNTTYHFRVKSRDNAGNEAVSRDYTYTTLRASTKVSGILSASTRWTAGKSPYEITETIQIPEGVTLTIEPGVIVNKPTGGNMFLLLGTLYAHGTAQEPIVFDGGGNSTIVGTHPGYGNGNFEYCVFKNGGALWDRWGKLNLRHSQLINLTLSSQNAISGAIIKLDGPSGEINIEYNKFVNTGGIYSYANKYGINIRYNMFNGLLSPLCNAGGGTSTTPNKMVVKFNSFVNIEGIILSLEPVFSPTIDATENYWGTTDIDVINLKIHDGKDDVRIGSYITYLPVLTSPHPSTPSPD